MCSQENLRNPNAPALPQVRADARTFSYVLGFSALLLFTVGAGPSARILRPAASAALLPGDLCVLSSTECSRRAVSEILRSLVARSMLYLPRLGYLGPHWGRR